MTTGTHLTELSEDSQAQPPQVLEIFDPELAMCLASRGFPRIHLRTEQGLEIFSYDITPALSDALEACDPEYEDAIWRIRDAGVARADEIKRRDGMR